MVYRMQTRFNKICHDSMISQVIFWFLVFYPSISCYSFQEEDVSRLINKYNLIFLLMGYGSAIDLDLVLPE